MAAPPAFPPQSSSTRSPRSTSCLRRLLIAPSAAGWLPPRSDDPRARRQKCDGRGEGESCSEFVAHLSKKCFHHLARLGRGRLGGARSLTPALDIDGTARRLTRHLAAPRHANAGAGTRRVLPPATPVHPPEPRRKKIVSQRKSSVPRRRLRVRLARSLYEDQDMNAVPPAFNARSGARL